MPAGTKYLIEDNMLSNIIENSDENSDQVVDHFHFTIRNQFLHAAHPLSWFRKIELSVDGIEIDSSDIYFVLRGQWFCASYLYTITETFWTLCEEAEIFVKKTGGLKVGPHNVTVILTTSSFSDTWFQDTSGLWPL